MAHTIPRPISGGLILSYTCNAECLHCMYACSPKWPGDWISEKDLETILGQLSGTIEPAPYGPDTIGLNHGLHFTGGEPFLNFELLCTAVEMAESLNIPSTFVESNCFWCTDDTATRDKLGLLKEKGLKGILVSVNPFYLEYVPFERTERGIRISLDLFGSNVAVYQLEYYRRFQEWGIRGRLRIEDYLKLERGNDLMRHVEFFIMGRAPYRLAEKLPRLYPRHPAAHFFHQPCLPPFLREWHNHFDNYGNYIPGYCGGITLGHVRDLEALMQKQIEAESYPILDLLVRGNMEGLLTYARNWEYRVAKEGYYSKCHLCLDIRKHLALQGDYAELKPKAFYTHLD